MIVSPEWYYEKYLARKEPKKILRKIKNIKNEINRLKEIEENLTNIKEYPISKSIFLRDLKDIYMGEWKKSYFSEEFIADGYQWKISIKYKNKKSLDYKRDNSFPYNFDDLLKCIREWLPDEETDVVI